jgi:hypothetical protein
VDEADATAGVADVWIGYDHHPVEARVAPDLSSHYTFRYSCFNRVRPAPFQPADRPRPHPDPMLMVGTS